MLELSPLDHGRVSKEDLARFVASAMKYSLSADLDSDGKPEDFFVGGFEDAVGSKARAGSSRLRAKAS